MTFSRELTEEEMETIKSQSSYEETLIAFYDVALADHGSSFEAEASIKPTEFRIPEPQWLDIADHVVKQFNFESHGEKVNYGLMWMNQGPSTIQEEK